VDVHYVIRLFWKDQVPGFAVGFEAHDFGLTVWVEAQHGLGRADFDWNDVPEIERDHMGGDEVDVCFGIDGASFAGGVRGAGFIGTGSDAFGAFDLNAVETLSVIKDEVVAAAVAPGLGDAESHVDGTGEKGGFGALSGDLGVLAVFGVLGLLGFGFVFGIGKRFTRHQNSWKNEMAEPEGSARLYELEVLKNSLWVKWSSATNKFDFRFGTFPIWESEIENQNQTSPLLTHKTRQKWGTHRPGLFLRQPQLFIQGGNHDQNGTRLGSAIKSNTNSPTSICYSEAAKEPDMAGKSLNRVQLIGNLGKDPEIKYTPQGTPVAKITIATNERFKDKGGEWQDRTEWHNVVLWQRLAEIAGEYLKKGGKVYIEGRLQTRSWDDKQTGQKKYMTEVVASDLILLGGRGEGGGGGDFGGSSRGSSSGSNNFDQRAPEHEPAASGPITDEDIPF